jgi:signal transduction histidine kinase
VPTATLIVADDGPGIPVADRQRVFDRFVRLGEGRPRDSGGTGLGLAIVSTIVAEHGGRVWIDGGEAGTALSCSYRPSRHSLVAPRKWLRRSRTVQSHRIRCNQTEELELP